jgi:Flp pilus assembly protein TadB
LLIPLFLPIPIDTNSTTDQLLKLFLKVAMFSLAFSRPTQSGHRSLSLRLPLLLLFPLLLLILVTRIAVLVLLIVVLLIIAVLLLVVFLKWLGNLAQKLQSLLLIWQCSDQLLHLKTSNRRP